MPQPVAPLEYVYVIGNETGSCLKIGISRDPTKRIRELQTGSGVALSVLFQQSTKHAFKVERRVHRTLAEHRERGEWFSVPHAKAVHTIKRAIREEAQEERERRRKARAEIEVKRREERARRMPLQCDFDGLIRATLAMVELGNASNTSVPKSLLKEISSLICERLEQVRDELLSLERPIHAPAFDQLLKLATEERPGFEGISDSARTLLNALLKAALCAQTQKGANGASGKP